jgi:hypothetical protein
VLVSRKGRAFGRFEDFDAALLAIDSEYTGTDVTIFQHGLGWPVKVWGAWGGCHVWEVEAFDVNRLFLDDWWLSRAYPLLEPEGERWEGCILARASRFRGVYV